MTNLTTERIIGLSHDPLKFYNEISLEETAILDEPLEFKEWMDQERAIEAAYVEGAETYGYGLGAFYTNQKEY